MANTTKLWANTQSADRQSE